ncbi:hypothetical protein ACKI1K_00155 [Streptomyces scabiei]|uniref:hypothetical protein n=1 Tax=Streptomyces scabiei TaxID=1930 RepID=UPI0038F6D870
MKPSNEGQMQRLTGQRCSGTSSAGTSANPARASQRGPRKTAEQPSESVALYRFYDRSGVLLYVGVTNDTQVRWYDHSRVKPWWPTVARKRIEWLPTRADAERAEAAAIAAENPLWNIMRPDHLGRMPLGGGKGGRPATGKTPLRRFRVATALWKAAQERAAAEGRTLTDVIVSALHRYVSAPPRTDGESD